MKFGDVLRYRSYDPETNWLFLYLETDGSASIKWLTVMVIQTPHDDDLWEIGDVIAAGVNELEVVPE